MQPTDMLQWFAQPDVAQRAAAGGPVVTADEVVHSTADSMPDDTVAADLGHLERYLSRVAWILVTSAGMHNN